MNEKDRIIELYRQSDFLDRIRLLMRYRELREIFDAIEGEEPESLDARDLFEERKPNHSARRILRSAVKAFLPRLDRSV